MAENLKTTKYNDGTLIPNVTDNTTWAGLTTVAYRWYNNDLNNKNIIGALYNWDVLEQIKWRRLAGMCRLILNGPT